MSSFPKLDRDFGKAVAALPKIFTPMYKPRFYRLIDAFGTHYISKVTTQFGREIRFFLLTRACFQVKLGGSVQSVTSIRQCKASLQGLNVEEIQMCLNAEASATVKGQTLSTELKHCQKDTQKMEFKTSFASLFNDRWGPPPDGSRAPRTGARSR